MAEHVTNVQPAALLAALVTMAVALLARPLNRWVPAMLLAVLAGALFAKLLAWAVPQWPALATVQALPGALPPLSWPDLSVDTVRSLFGATLVMTLLALTEATAIAKAVARQHNDVLDGNREFIGQGLANLAGAFSLVDAGQRLVQPLGRQRRGRCAHAAGRGQRGACSWC